jgi:hypothetical protein
MFIEPDSDLVFGVDDEREDGRLGPHCTCDRIDDEQAAKPASTKFSVDGEPAVSPSQIQASCRHDHRHAAPAKT